MQFAFAQPKTITGVIQNKTDVIPTSYVSVLIKSSNKSSVTNMDGKYSTSALPSDIIVFRSLSSETKEIKIACQQIINISLLESSRNLEEIVVVGFASKTKANFTAAVTVITVDRALANKPATDVRKGLYKSKLGLNITFDCKNIGGRANISICIAGSPRNIPGTITGTTIANLSNVAPAVIFIPRAGRVYTIFCRGIVGGLPTATVNSPAVTFIINR